MEHKREVEPLKRVHSKVEEPVEPLKRVYSKVEEPVESSRMIPIPSSSS